MNGSEPAETTTYQPSAQPLPVVYVVDDDPYIRKLFISIVESMKLQAVACQNAEELLATDLGQTPCCLIADLRLPGMNGLSLLQHLEASGRLIPTIIVTGYAETSIAVASLHAGAVTFLEKPVRPFELSEAISRALDRSREMIAQNADREQLIRTWRRLTAEERQIIQGVASGYLNKEIAFRIGAPLRTIEDRRRRVMEKIGGRSVADLIRFAIRIEGLGESSTGDTPHGS